MTKDIQNKLLEIIRTKSKKYLVTIKDLVLLLGYSNGLIHRHIKILEGKGLIEAKRVARPKGGVTYYKTLEAEWPKHLGKKCFNCQNKGKNLRCTYHEELAEKGVFKRAERVGVLLTENTVACNDFIERKTHWYRRKYEDFLDENRRITVSKKGLTISYHCANKKCQAELLFLGDGFIAKLGSSVVRCDACNSFYKTLYDQKKEVFMVHYNIEKGLEYKKNFASATRGEEPEALYTSDYYGIVIHNLQDCKFNFRTRTLTNNNWLGTMGELNYLVVKRKEDYEQLIGIIEAKGYGEIQVILGADKIISPPPIKQQVGLLRLLREIMIINKEFCTAMLASRITIIKRVHQQFNYENESVVRKAVKAIEQLIVEVEGKEWITPEEWNTYEMRAGNAMWRVVKVYLKTLGIDFPGRVRCRLVEDISKPHRRFYAYSPIDALINGVYGIAGEFVKEYCYEISFCWDGLPGLCHEKTRGGVFGFHLDMREQEKILTIPYLLSALQMGTIELEKVLYLRGRNRQKIYFVKQETELEKQIYQVVDEMKSGEVNGGKAKNIIKNYYLQGKQWLRNFQRGSNYCGVEQHGIEYQPWTVMKEKVWDSLGKKEREELIDNLSKVHKKIGYKPLIVTEMN